MVMFYLDFIVKATRGRVLNRGRDIVFQGVSTDSRLLRAGDLFFALKGDRYDGHDFLATAFIQGASGAVVERPPTESFPNKTLIAVKSTRRALGDLAHSWRESMKELVLAAVTGSNGKTTTKEMAYSILSAKSPALKNHGNFNNDIGLPLSLLNLRPHHRRAVVEFGMSDFGEIRQLARIADPDTGAITNIGRAHLEKLGGIEGVARAKAELLEGFGPKNTFVANMDDPRVVEIAKNVSCRKITVGLNAKGADIAASDITPLDSTAIKFNLRVGSLKLPIRIKGMGVHNVQNALIASGIALSLGCGVEEIQAGLERYVPIQMRLEVMNSPMGYKIINDAYNANPESMRRGLEELVRLKVCGARAIAVLGDMLELGEATQEEHRSLGAFASSCGLDLVVAYGNFAPLVLEGVDSKLDSRLARSHEEAAEIVAQFAKPGDVVLVKGSRGMRMEYIIQRLFTG